MMFASLLFVGWAVSCHHSKDIMAIHDQEHQSGPRASDQLAADPQISRKVIDRLIEQLKVADIQQRRQAYKQLLEIGPPVPAELWKRDFSRNPVALPSVVSLLADIQAKHGVQPIRIDGLEFVTVGDRKWKRPLPGNSQDIKLAIKLTNYHNRDILFYRFDSIHVALAGSDGKLLRQWGGRDHVDIRNVLKSVRLRGGESSAILDVTLRLCWNLDETELQLVVDDGCNSLYHFVGLHSGRYIVCVNVEDHGWVGDQRQLPVGAKRWRGKAALVPLVVEID